MANLVQQKLEAETAITAAEKKLVRVMKDAQEVGSRITTFRYHQPLSTKEEVGIARNRLMGVKQAILDGSLFQAVNSALEVLCEVDSEEVAG